MSSFVLGSIGCGGLAAVALTVFEILPLDLNRQVARLLFAFENKWRPRLRRRRIRPVRIRPLGFKQLPPLAILKVFYLQPLGFVLLLDLDLCGRQFRARIGRTCAHWRAVLEQLPQEVGALDPVGGFVSRDRTGSNGQKS